MSANAWSGRAVTRARTTVATWLPAPCGRCGKTVELGSRWVVGHKVARSLRPDLTWEISNWQPEHRACSDATAQQAVIDKARANALQEAGFPPQTEAGQPPPLPVSLSGATSAQFEVRGDLLWTSAAMRRYGWLKRFARVPRDASPPLFMSLPPPDAVGSYGAQAIRWIEKSQGITLRWWQRLAITRQLEHRDDGSLVHREVIESAPRRAGKSVRVRGLALWRMAHASLFGEVQTIVHTGSDVAICRKLQRDSWRWAERTGWTVTRANGKEAIETPEGDQWLVRSQQGVYGWDACLALVDEGWDVKPDTVTEGLEPAMLERQSPQLHLTSTAHRRATSLMRSKIAEALTTEDPQVLVLIWAAPFGSEPADPKVWRAASPHWTEDRRLFVARKYAAAAAGQADPEADDPDPMAGFEAQYLNLWRLRERVATRGDGVVSEDQWAALAAEAPFVRPDAAAIESWFSEGVSLALAWRAGSQAIVSVSDHPDLASAVVALRESGFRGTTTVGASLMKDPALLGTRRRAGEGRVGAAVQELARMVAEGVVRHDDGEHLTAQVLAVRTLPGADGPRMVSVGRADAVKAAGWAVGRARAAPSGSPRIILPTGA